MNEKTEMQKVSAETMRFMRGKYELDEVGDGKDELKFRRGNKTVLTVYIRNDRHDFLVIFGRAEREKFEARRGEFPQKIQEIYDNSKTHHDGKRMMIPVADLDTLEAVKKLALIKKKPNRKPFPVLTAVYSRCGMRCDLCVHYTGETVIEELRAERKDCVGRIFGAEMYGDDMMLCPGGSAKDCGDCPKTKCFKSKQLESCLQCGEYPCGNCGIVTSEITPNSCDAKDITVAILPYVDGQYGN